MKKIGFFGGTFDPLHFGHLHLAIELLERCSLDEVLLCPAHQSPFKKEEESVSAEHRLAMARHAIEEIPHMDLCDLEVKRGGVSYTVDTLRELYRRYKAEGQAVRLFLLLSSEALGTFHHWKEADQIAALAQPLVGVRSGAHENIPDSSVQESLRRGLVHTPRMDLSSTEVRQRLKKNLYCGHLLPRMVLDYILRHRLYSPSF